MDQVQERKNKMGKEVETQMDKELGMLSEKTPWGAPPLSSVKQMGWS